ncbi:MAG TPA: hypothetical protein VGF35_05600 [Steroidobacteraceae bacterium]
MRTAAPTLAVTWLVLSALGQAAPVYALVAGRGGGALQDVPRQLDPPAPQPAAVEEPESTVQVRIESVNSLSDYAAVTRLLQATPGVRRVSVTLVERSSATFEVSVRGGAAGLEQALAAQSRLAHEGAAPVYRYQPAAGAATAPSPP